LNNKDASTYTPINWFHTTFKQSSLDDFRNFLNPYKQMQVTKWLIFSDYCLKDRNKLYDAITFTIVPYIDNIQDLKFILGEIAPKDLKKTIDIDDRFCDFIKSGYCFNISIVFEKNSKKLLPLTQENCMDQIDILISQYNLWTSTTPSNKEYYEKVIKKLKQLKQKAESKSFNLTLFRNIGFIQMIVAYLMTTITRECGYKIENIGWFSDRDSVVEWIDGFIYDILQANYHGMCSLEGIKEYEAQAIAVSGDNKGKKHLWYDEINRIPDYLTGALAGRNFISETKDKYDILFEKAISDNPYLTVIFYSEEGEAINTRRVSFSPKK
jgi:hypothetical protein